MAFITIPLFYDLDLLKFTTAAGGITQQPNLVLGQSDNINFSVQFVSGGVGYDLGDPSFIFAIKEINDTSGDYLVQSTTGTKNGSGTATTYSFEVVLDSTELRAWLLTVTAVTNYAALSIRDTTNEIATLPALTCSILPDYTLDGTTPTDASGTLIVDSGQTFTVHKTFAMPADNGTNNYVLKTNGAGVGSWGIALLAESQTLTAAQVTQALANLGIARASLSAPVTRTSATGTTLTNTGLTALTVTLAASTRYRLTYRLYASGVNGFKIAFNFPSALATFDAKLLTYDFYNAQDLTIIIPDWPTVYGASGSTVIEAGPDATQYGGLEFVADILTGSTSNTFGDFSVSFAQYVSGATASTMSKNSCVEVLKFP